MTVINERPIEDVVREHDDTLRGHSTALGSLVLVGGIRLLTAVAAGALQSPWGT